MPSFTKNNIDHSLLVCMDTKDRSFHVYGDSFVTLDSYLLKNGPETLKIWNMGENFIHHDADISFKTFPISSYDISKFEMLFMKNTMENGYLKIEGKLYFRPEFYIVKRVDKQNTNNCVNNLLFNEYSYEDSDGIRVFLHVCHPSEGIENHVDLLDCIKDYLIEKQ